MDQPFQPMLKNVPDSVFTFAGFLEQLHEMRPPRHATGRKRPSYRAAPFLYLVLIVIFTYFFGRSPSVIEAVFSVSADQRPRTNASANTRRPRKATPQPTGIVDGSDQPEES
ncbi:hypothetical protein MRX96_051106 [Rhipicephalus microplus]